MATPKLIPVDDDPFAVAGGGQSPTATSAPTLEPVDDDPFAPVKPSHSLLGVARTGAIQGLTDVVGLPDTVGRLFLKASDYLNPTAKAARAKSRANPIDPTGTGSRFAYARAAIDKQPELLDEPSVQQSLEDKAFSYVPKDDAQTTLEKYIQAGARGASGAAVTGGLTAAPGALLSTALRTAGSGAAGALASEGAGDATKGTKYEPYARFLAGLVAGGGTQAGLNKFTTSDAILDRALTGYSHADFQAADDLMQRSAAQGMQLTPAESLAQVRGGNTPLMSVQRYTENAPESSPVMHRFMEARPAQNATAVTGSLDTVAPMPMNPTEVGPRVQQAAQTTLNQTRQGINEEARPFYDLAQGQNDQLVGYGINPHAGPQWDALTQNPAFNVALRQVRADPLNHDIAHLPDYDLTVLDAVKKRMDLSAGEATNPGIGRPPDTRTAARYTNASQALRNTVDDTFEDYRNARNIGEEGRERFLEPQGRAPIGQLANTGEATAQQNVLLPKLATEGSPQQIRAAVHHLVANGAGDDARQLIRLKLQDVFDTALPNVKGNAEQFRGANFANQLTRYENQIQSLGSAIRAVPGGDDIWNRLNDTIQGLRAQGQRLPVGSSTEFNRMITAEASKPSSLVALPFRTAQTVTNMGKSAMENMALRGSQRSLASAMTRPNTRGLQEIANRPNLTKLQIFMNGLLQSGR